MGAALSSRTACQIGPVQSGCGLPGFSFRHVSTERFPQRRLIRSRSLKQRHGCERGGRRVTGVGGTSTMTGKGGHGNHGIVGTTTACFDVGAGDGKERCVASGRSLIEPPPGAGSRVQPTTTRHAIKTINRMSRPTPIPP
jgi:hypothetical protein